MSDYDKQLKFIHGLQPWARKLIFRMPQLPDNLQELMRMAERLGDDAVDKKEPGGEVKPAKVGKDNNSWQERKKHKKDKHVHEKFELTRPCSLHELNSTFGSQFGLAVCPLAQEKLVTASRRHSERSPCICFCSPLQDPPLGSWGRSGTLPIFSSETSWGRISLTNYPIGVFLSLLESSSI